MKFSKLRIVLFIGSLFLALGLTGCLGNKNPKLDRYTYDQLKSNIALNNNRNEAILLNIREEVLENGNKPAEAKLLAQTEEIRDESKNVVNFLKGLEDQLIEKSGGLSETGAFLNPDDYEGPKVLLNPENRLQEVLSNYVDFLNKYLIEGKQLQNLASDGASDPYFNNSRDFEENYFGGLTATQALCILRTLEMRVYLLENEVLKEYRLMIGKMAVD